MANQNLYNPKKTRIIFASIIMILAVTALVIVIMMMLHQNGAQNGGTKTSTVVTNSSPTTSLDSTPVATPTLTPEQTPAPTPTPSPTPTPTPTPETKASVKVAYKQNTRGSLILVNEDSLYYSEIIMPASKDLGNHLVYTEKKLADTFGFVNVYLKKSSSYLLSGSNIFLNSDAFAAFDRMLSDFYAETGLPGLMIKYAYYNSTNNGLADEHVSGLAIDLAVYLDGVTYALSEQRVADYYSWLVDNCTKYGVIQRFGTSHPEHFRYVGVAHAKYMEAKSLSLEDYLDVLQTTSFEKRLTLTDGNNEYWIYYVKGTPSGDTTLPIIASLPYTISGDNAGGFIVVVDASNL